MRLRLEETNICGRQNVSVLATASCENKEQTSVSGWDAGGIFKKSRSIDLPSQFLDSSDGFFALGSCEAYSPKGGRARSRIGK